MFGPEQFGQLIGEIRDVKLNTDFLVVGWELGGPIFRMFSLNDGGKIAYHDDLGFHAIGAGWVQALGTLYRTYHPELSTQELIYRVCEAKFAGEVAPGVGKLTAMVLLRPDTTQTQVSAKAVDRLRTIYHRQSPKFPALALRIIDKALEGRDD